MDTNSTTEVAPERRSRRILRLLLRSALVLILVVSVAALVGHFTWKYSGTSQWEKVGEQGGITLYEMKVPGDSIKKFKAAWKLKTSLSKFAMWVTDTAGDTEHSMRREIGLYEHRVIEDHGVQDITTAWKQPFVSFLDHREFVVRSEIWQDPNTSELFYKLTGVPDRIPPDDCCVRIPVMRNKWRLTPLKTGELDVEWEVDLALGGAVPYVIQNEVLPGGMWNFAPRVQTFVDQDKYKNAKYDWIREELPQLQAAKP